MTAVMEDLADVCGGSGRGSTLKIEGTERECVCGGRRDRELVVVSTGLGVCESENVPGNHPMVWQDAGYNTYCEWQQLDLLPTQFRRSLCATVETIRSQHKATGFDRTGQILACRGQIEVIAAAERRDRIPAETIGKHKGVVTVAAEQFIVIRPANDRCLATAVVEQPVSSVAADECDRGENAGANGNVIKAVPAIRHNSRNASERLSPPKGLHTHDFARVIRVRGDFRDDETFVFLTRRHIPHAGPGADIQVERTTIEALTNGVVCVAGEVYWLRNFHIEQIERRADINFGNQQVKDNSRCDVNTSGAAFKTECDAGTGQCKSKQLYGALSHSEDVCLKVPISEGFRTVSVKTTD